MSETVKHVVVFCGSRVDKADVDFLAARRLGTALHKIGFEVWTGGYGGLMEAVSEGVAAAGGAPSAVTLRAFAKPANRFVSREVETDTLFERCESLCKRADAVVVLTGGMGTLAELALSWILVETGERRMPIFLVGAQWRALINLLRRQFWVSEDDVRLLTLVESVEELVDRLRDHAALQRPAPGPKWP